MHTEKKGFGGVDTSNITAQETELFAGEGATLPTPIATANDIKPSQPTLQTEQVAMSESTKHTSPRQRMNEYI